MISLSILLLRALIMPVVTFSVAHSGATLARIGMTQGLLSLASVFVSAIAWVLLLAAALGWREGP